MSRLDDASVSRAVDPQGMLRVALDLPHQVREAWTIGSAASLPRLAGPPVHLVFAGMGGSAIGGDLLAAFAGVRLAIPMVVVRDSRLPAFVGSRSVVFATSYSGETEETLVLAGQAVRAGATLIAITRGGRLAEMAGPHGTTIRVPGGLAPRAALGYLMISALAVLERWNLAGPCGAEVEEAARTLEQIAAETDPAVPTARNAAKRLAEQLTGCIPAVYAASPEVEAAARRWKCQFNENSKTLATWNVFPELNHNETVGWEAPPEIARMFAVVVLLAGDEAQQVRRQVRLASDLAFRPAAGVHEVHGRGEGRLARLLSLVMLGDLTSIYLAYLRGVDPTPVAMIETLKQRMRPEGSPPPP